MGGEMSMMLGVCLFCELSCGWVCWLYTRSFNTYQLVISVSDVGGRSSKWTWSLWYYCPCLSFCCRCFSFFFFFPVRPCRIVGGDRADFFLVAWHTNANRNYEPFGHLYPRASLKGGILFESIYLFFQEHSYVATQSRWRRWWCWWWWWIFW